MRKYGSRRETRARHEQAAHLRACGYTWAQISEHLGYRHRQAAQTAVERLYARTVESPDLTRRSLADGLRTVKTVLYEGLAAAKTNGDNAAAIGYAREIRATTDQLAKLDGLHAPQRVEVGVTHRSAEMLVAFKQQLFDAIDAEVVERPALSSADSEVQ